MANKKKTKVEVEEPQVEEQFIDETPKEVFEEIVEKPILKQTITEPQNKTTKNDWELKDRMYVLVGNKKPLSKMIRSAGIYWFDEEKGYEREIKYCENQRTCFVDEMKGDQRLSHIIFRNGMLPVPKEKTILQKLLSLYHPHKESLYRELKPEVRAADEVAIIELEIQALNCAKEMGIDMAEAIIRVEVGSAVSKMSSREVKRDLLVFAKRNPRLFLDLVHDENVHLRNIGIKATEMGIIRLSQDQRTFIWTSNDRKLMNVPFDEHPYSALAAWFKTDEGMEVYSSIEKRLNN